jgi:hypothetical protein
MYALGMKKKKITIDDLAVMIARGFEATASKEEMNNRFDRVNEKFDEMEERLDRIENLILTDHRNRLERLEDKVRVLETAAQK